MMNDDADDVDILDDIKALEHALAQESILLAFNDDDEDDDDDDDDRRGSFVCNSLPEKTILPESKLFTSESDLFDTIESVIKVNASLLESYKSALNTINTRLNDCIKRQQEVDYQIQLIDGGGKVNWRIPYFKAGQPYFKDENLFPAPPNDDLLKKQKRDEYPVVYSRLPGKWSPKGRANLWAAVRNDASGKYLQIMKSMNRKNEDASSMEFMIPSDFTDMLKTVGETELDWLKISVKDMKGRHSWQACKSMWDLYMNPLSNRGKWRQDEDKMLITLAKSYNYQDWDLIAEKLGSQRTCYQCFVRFNTLSPPSMMNMTDAPWTTVENELVMELIGKLRIGDVIPWALVTFYLGSRTKNQIYCHWKYNLDPTLKKGRFTSVEDQKLLNAVDKYGENFSRIATECFPHRTSVQLSTRFRLLMLKTNESYNSWTIAEDKRLLGLYDEFGNNWSVIGNIMNKDRTYVRHHYAALTRHLSKGMKLIDIPRKSSTSANDNDEDSDSNIDARVNENIDVQLVRYFQNTDEVEPGPSKKRKLDPAEQLEIKTKQLRDIFRKLNVNISIPDNLDNIKELTAMDKKLLKSFKRSGDLESSNYTPEQIEEYRKKMFPNSHSNDGEKFIPPGPFGLFQNIRKRGNAKNKGTSTVCDDCNIDLIKKFETPENVIKMLSSDEIKFFDKYIMLIKKRCKIAQYPGRFEEANVKSIRILDISHGDLNSPGTSKSLVKNESTDGVDVTFIEPCYSTLVGYQSLLHMQEILGKPTHDLSIDGKFGSIGSKAALNLLKNRCLTLFKYPIGMARIPMIYKRKTNSDTCDYNEDDEEDDDDDYVNENDVYERRNVPALRDDEAESPTDDCERIDKSGPEVVEVSTPVRLSLNMVKTLRKKNVDKVKKSTNPVNKL